MNRSGRYARFYSFQAGQAGDYEIELTSTVNAYLFILNGAGTDGAVIGSNNDIDGSRNRNSRVTIGASANNYYTIEATTFSSSTTGNFSVTIDPPASGGSTSSCSVTDLGTISTSEVTRAGSWTSGCDSVNRSGRYARFYSFQAGSAGEYQLTLVSTTDPYLFLLNGSGTGGSEVDSNDDIGGGNQNSRITFTATANGYYTVEATTFDESATGSFTLTIDPPDAVTPPVAPSGNSWSTYINSRQEPNDDEYGYKYNDFGSIGDRTFELDGTTFTIEYIKWDDSLNRFRLYLRGCLKPSRFQSIVVGSTTFAIPSLTLSTDRYCTDNPDADQYMRWSSVTTNPLPANTRVNVTVNFNDPPPPPPPVTIQINSATASEPMPDAGQPSTLTVDASASDGGTLSYRWQGFVGGAWTDVSSNFEHTVTSVSAVIRTYQVIVTHVASGTTATSSPVTIRIISAEASEPMPDAGQPSTLTVDASASDGGTLSYRWQELDGTSRTDISTNIEATVTFASAVEKTYQVIVTHVASGAMATSSPVTIRWSDPSPPPVTIHINSVTPSDHATEVGQPSTLTVDASASDGGTLSYRWQEFVDGAWTDVSTGFEYEVTPDEAGARTFRVKVTHVASGESVTSTEIMMTAVVVTISSFTASDLTPLVNEGVALVVRVSASDGGTQSFQWQRWKNNGWSNVSGPKNSKRVGFNDAGAKTYRVVVTHVDSGASATSPEITVTWRPPAPTGLRANGASTSDATAQGDVRWEAVTGADSYEIRYGDECASAQDVCSSTAASWATPTGAGSSASHTITGLSIETLYRVQVRSVQNGVASDWSEPAFVLPTASQPTATVAGIPYFAYHTSRQYVYNVCESTFTTAWETAIDAAVAAWNSELEWPPGSADVLSLSEDTASTCVAETPTSLPVAGEVRLVANDVNFDGICGALPMPLVRVACAVQTSYGSPGATDAQRNFAQMPPILFRNQGDTYWMSQPGPACSDARRVAAHELGHAVGLGHTTLRNVSVLGPDDAFCRPTGYDVAASMALYQSLP